MALDKQKILSELGNVVNQLQSADCGCMGKLFSNSGQTNSNSSSTPNEFSGGMGSCCGHHGRHSHHGYNAPCAGEPYTGARHCMGYCNPPKLYADTYSYLNKNMMQPVVQEVYDDLKSINSNNTVMNNPMASQLGLSQANDLNQGNMAQNAMIPQSSVGNNHMHGHNPHVHFGNALLHPGQQDSYHDPNIGMGQMNQEMSQPPHGTHQMEQEIGQSEHGMSHMGQGMCQMTQGMRPRQMEQGMHRTGQMMGGMGPHIVNMMNSAKNNFNPRQANPSINTTDDKVHHSPEMGYSMPHTAGDPNMGQYNPGQLQKNADYIRTNNTPPENYGLRTTNLLQPNIASGGVGHGNNSMVGMQQRSFRQQPIGSINSSPQQINNSNPYGQHSAGIAKFNEMFPGVMRSDLGFDPMAIAIQMNPANQQKSAMDTMQKMMMNNSGGMNRIMDSPQMQPVVNATNAVTASSALPNQQLTGKAPDQQNIQQQRPGEVPAGDLLQNNQTLQQVYTAVTEAPTINQQQISNKQNVQQPHGQIQQTPNQQLTGSLPTVYEGSEESVPNQKFPAHSGPPANIAQHMYKEPIFPADTSRHLLQSHHFKAPKYNYNTLGQPIEMVSAVDYQTLAPNLPHTMSGHGVLTRTAKDSMALNNLKATVSKTAILGNRPIGKTPSRSQLHHEYNQYKGSHSFTQQNIRPSGYTGSHSEGRINISQGHAPPQHYIERIGGDTVINDQIPANDTKLEENVNQIGDVPTAKKPLNDPGMTGMRNNKTRNGLQDQVYSSYPTSAKWSFHGSTPAPYSVGYRFRAK